MPRPDPYARQLAALQADVLDAARGAVPRRRAALAPGAALGPAEGVALLGRLVRARLRASLVEDLPRLAGRLGPRRFDALLDDLLASGPRSASLAAVTDELVARSRAALGPRLAALAELEAARARALVAPDPDPLPAPASADPARLRLVLHPSVTLLPARVVWRRGGELLERRLGPAERAALGAARDGEPLARVSARAPRRAAGWCRAWVEAGLVVGARAR